MKRKYYILGLLATLCLLGTGYYAWTLYDAHRKQVAEWNEGAKAAFEEALWTEVNKRAEVPIYYSSNADGRTITLKEEIPDSIFVMTPMGRKGYRIEKNKYEKSLIKERKKRMIMGTLFLENPLSVDSLAIYWNKKLLAKEIPAQSQIRYICTDWDLKNDTTYSGTSKHLGLDSLSVNYLGFRCEHELKAFVSYPYWLLRLSGGDMVCLLLPWVLLVIFFMSYTPIELFIQNRLIKEKIVEKEIHVADVTIDKAKVFQLPDGSLFDSFKGTLTKGNFVHTLPPQSALLLRSFLRKENHRLSTDEIEQELWKGNGSPDKIHKVIQRLRDELKKVSSDLLIKNVNGDYELK